MAHSSRFPFKEYDSGQFGSTQDIITKFINIPRRPAMERSTTAPMTSSEEQSVATPRRRSASLTSIRATEEEVSTLTQEQSSNNSSRPTQDLLRFKVAHHFYPKLELEAFALLEAHAAITFTFEAVTEFLAGFLPKINVLHMYSQIYGVPAEQLPSNPMIFGRQIYKWLATEWISGDRPASVACGKDVSFDAQHPKICEHWHEHYRAEEAHYETAIGRLEWHCMTESTQATFVAGYKQAMTKDFDAPVDESSSQRFHSLLDERSSKAQSTGGKDIVITYLDVTEKVVPLLTQLVQHGAVCDLDDPCFARLISSCRLLIAHRPLTHHSEHHPLTLRLIILCRGLIPYGRDGAVALLEGLKLCLGEHRLLYESLGDEYDAVKRVKKSYLDETDASKLARIAIGLIEAWIDTVVVAAITVPSDLTHLATLPAEMVPEQYPTRFSKSELRLQDIKFIVAQLDFVGVGGSPESFLGDNLHERSTKELLGQIATTSSVEFNPPWLMLWHPYVKLVCHNLHALEREQDSSIPRKAWLSWLLKGRTSDFRFDTSPDPDGAVMRILNAAPEVITVAELLDMMQGAASQGDSELSKSRSGVASYQGTLASRELKFVRDLSAYWSPSNTTQTLSLLKMPEPWLTDFADGAILPEARLALASNGHSYGHLIRIIKLAYRGEWVADIFNDNGVLSSMQRAMRGTERQDLGTRGELIRAFTVTEFAAILSYQRPAPYGTNYTGVAASSDSQSLSQETREVWGSFLSNHPPAIEDVTKTSQLQNDAPTAASIQPLPGSVDREDSAAAQFKRQDNPLGTAPSQVIEKQVSIGNSTATQSSQQENAADKSMDDSVGEKTQVPQKNVEAPELTKDGTALAAASTPPQGGQVDNEDSSGAQSTEHGTGPTANTGGPSHDEVADASQHEMNGDREGDKESPGDGETPQSPQKATEWSSHLQDVNHFYKLHIPQLSHCIVARRLSNIRNCSISQTDLTESLLGDLITQGLLGSDVVSSMFDLAYKQEVQSFPDRDSKNMEEPTSTGHALLKMWQAQLKTNADVNPVSSQTFGLQSMQNTFDQIEKAHRDRVNQAASVRMVINALHGILSPIYLAGDEIGAGMVVARGTSELCIASYALYFTSARQFNAVLARLLRQMNCKGRRCEDELRSLAVAMAAFVQLRPLGIPLSHDPDTLFLIGFMLFLERKESSSHRDSFLGAALGIVGATDKALTSVFSHILDASKTWKVKNPTGSDLPGGVLANLTEQIIVAMANIIKLSLPSTPRTSEVELPAVHAGSAMGRTLDMISTTDKAQRLEAFRLYPSPLSIQSPPELDDKSDTLTLPQAVGRLVLDGSVDATDFPFLAHPVYVRALMAEAECSKNSPNPKVQTFHAWLVEFSDLDKSVWSATWTLDTIIEEKMRDVHKLDNKLPRKIVLKSKQTLKVFIDTLQTFLDSALNESMFNLWGKVQWGEHFTENVPIFAAKHKLKQELAKASGTSLQNRYDGLDTEDPRMLAILYRNGISAQRLGEVLSQCIDDFDFIALRKTRLDQCHGIHCDEFNLILADVVDLLDWQSPFPIPGPRAPLPPDPAFKLNDSDRFHLRSIQNKLRTSARDKGLYTTDGITWAPPAADQAPVGGLLSRGVHAQPDVDVPMPDAPSEESHDSNSGETELSQEQRARAEVILDNIPPLGDEKYRRDVFRQCYFSKAPEAVIVEKLRKLFISDGNQATQSHTEEAADNEEAAGNEEPDVEVEYEDQGSVADAQGEEDGVQDAEEDGSLVDSDSDVELQEDDEGGEEEEEEERG